ncbi:hypothetical protein TruAng_006609 [Truncatella angustata]|nr:hypothetical protein TruAng_006609 [Truncatella angustata]
MVPRRSLMLLLGGISIGVYGVDTYSSSDFIRRTGHAVNDTLSIPLDVTWTNKTVPITSIEKAAPVFDTSALWTDQTSESMYMWGGQGPWGNLSKTKDLWKFSANENSWRKQPAANVDIFMSIKRTSNAAVTQCNGMGFFIGGMGSVWTDSSFAAGDLAVPSPGMLTYNITSGVWANESLAGLNSYETYISGSAACLPSFGTSGNGMVLALGGEISRRSGYNSSEPNLIGLGNLSFWDIETKTWFFQQTTGDIPSPRSKFCVVDVAGQNGTHEIFLFGGYDGSNQASFQDIYVLSVPGFVWIKSSVSTDGPRTSQQCIVAGKRQMIIVGGMNPDLDYYPALRDPDPWPNGINVLDISSLSWNSEFDPDAAAYESPDAVTKWYNAGNLGSVDWTSGTVKSLFIETSSNSNSSSGVGSAVSSSTGGSSAPIGAIVGGVIGGVAFLILAGLAFWFFRRRTSKQDAQPAVQEIGEGYHNYPTPPPVYDSHQQEKSPQELFQEPAMLAAVENPSELDITHGSGQRPHQGWALQGVHSNLHEMA